MILTHCWYKTWVIVHIFSYSSRRLSFVNLSGYPQVEITKPHGKDPAISRGSQEYSRTWGNRNPPNQSSHWNICNSEKRELWNQANIVQLSSKQTTPQFNQRTGISYIYLSSANMGGWYWPIVDITTWVIVYIFSYSSRRAAKFVDTLQHWERILNHHCLYRQLCT